ncbi:Electron transport complex subunit RsxD [bioreactor metagenome]|uniref:Electron transport complex subunit RsxD n=1 Tax=bioreactor metagenome TaxID=1076179 RepID=A0A644YCM7_9ZZZZ
MSQNTRLSVAPSPHTSSPVGTRSLMLDVLIALIPALGIGVYFFGPRVIVLCIVSVLGCEIFEWGYRKLLKKSNTTGDLSAVVTGVLLVFCLPATIPYWTVIIGDFFAMVIVKQLFGGLGMNFLNPALAARAFMFSYPVLMTTWVKPGSQFWVSISSAADAVTAATPLAALHKGILPEAAAATGLLAKNFSLADMFIGNIGGCIGEVSAFMLLLGGAYLLIRGVIRLRVPVAFIGTVAVLTFLFPKGNSRIEWMLYNILAGGVMLGAIFMATDYATSPVTPKGEIIYGIGCGALTVFIRYFGAYVEGVSYAILIMNVCVWLIDKYCVPARFGVTAEMKKAAKLKAKAAKKGGEA